MEYFFLNEAVDELDNGPVPSVSDINAITNSNSKYRATLWTGEELQVTLMNIEVGSDIGLEQHTKEDQILVITNGIGTCKMGLEKDDPTFIKEVKRGSMIFIPKGYWHNVENDGDVSLQLYAIYGPPHHEQGTVHTTPEHDEESED